MGTLDPDLNARDGGRRAAGSCRWLWLSVLTMPLVCAAQATGEADRAAVALSHGVEQTATHAATDSFVYSVNLDAGRNYLLSLEQHGLDLVVTVETPNGVKRSYNSPSQRDGAEYVLVENAAPGAYEIIVHSDEYTQARGGHGIVVTELPVATAPSELEAWRAMTRGAAANFDSGEEAWGVAVEAYDAAVSLWREVNQAELEAAALFGAATVDYWQLYNWTAAAQRAAAAAALYDMLAEPALMANAIHLQAAALVESVIEAKQSADGIEITAETAANFDTVLRLLDRAATTQAELGNNYDLGLITNNFGYTYYYMGSYDDARSHYQQAAELLRNVGETTAELNPRYNLALLEIEQGQLASAIGTFERILEILPPGALNEYRSATLDNLGAAHRAFGNAEEALRIFATALELQTKIDDRQGVGRSMRRIAETYYGLGELALAEQYLEQALPVARQTSDGGNQQATLQTWGNVAYSNRDYTAAHSYHRQALEVSTSIPDRARLQLLVSKDLRALGRGDEALVAASEALDVARDSDSELLLADALNELGRAQLGLGPGNQAAVNLERARTIYEQLSLNGSVAEALHGLALAARSENRLQDAVNFGEASLAELESLRIRVADPELRAFFSGARKNYYETQIALLMALYDDSNGGDPTSLHKAFEASERARARMTTDLLQEASIDLQYDVGSDLKEREQLLYARLAEATYRRDLLLEQNADSTDPALKPILAELAALENELNLLDIDVRRSSPRYARLGQSRSLTTAEVQQELDADTVLLQYALGDNSSYVWIVTNEAVRVVELADRATLERAAREALAELSTYSGPASVGSATNELAALVLEPVAEHLQAHRVVLALDGALQYIPFAVLPLGSDAGATTLLSQHQIVEIPSMSAIAALRELEGSAAAAKTLAVFADPVFESTDPRLGPGGSEFTATVAPDRTRSRLGGKLLRLQSSGYEARLISELVPENQRLVASGFDASRDAVTGGDLSEYRYVHFATHGLIDSRYPGLSALALSQFDASGMAQDGFLRLHDIYGLDLNADLVVLSACETALGREVRGEGLVGLTQGFMYAGARSVIASLWQVPDRATAELMARFYEYLINEGLSPAEALRKAQLASAAERRWRDPYFWGGFVLLGDWR